MKEQSIQPYALITCLGPTGDFKRPEIAGLYPQTRDKPLGSENVIFDCKKFTNGVCGPKEQVCIFYPLIAGKPASLLEIKKEQIKTIETKFGRIVYDSNMGSIISSPYLAEDKETPRLSRIEKIIFELLISDPGHVFSIRDIQSYIAEKTKNHPPSDRSIQVHMGWIRGKLGRPPAVEGKDTVEGNLIQTRIKQGYFIPIPNKGN